MKKTCEEVDAKAKQVLADAIQRYASETTVHHDFCDPATDDLKGVYWKKGHNAFEAVTGGCDCGRHPGSIVMSGFDYSPLHG